MAKSTQRLHTTMGFKVLFFLSLFVISSCSDMEDTDRRKNPFPPEISEVNLVGPNIISSAQPEFASTWNDELGLLLFNRLPDDRSRIDLFITHWQDTSWSAPEIVLQESNVPTSIHAGAAIPYFTAE